ncbi:ion transporter [Marivita lacus]|uniref:Ion transporter n=2 Tax=Marivita lacus TaxID=1323742 RepID=A0ABQ1KVA9_9RHOB|nr:ion transporter [Marivita lacus]
MLRQSVKRFGAQPGLSAGTQWFRQMVPTENLWHVAQMEELHRTVRLLYTGQSQRARRFRYGLIVFDAVTIAYFIATAALPATPAMTALNIGLGLLILLDVAARLWISDNLRRELTRIYTLTDLVVVLSLLLAPFITESFAFLRVLRALRLIHAYHLLRDLRRESLFFRLHEDAILAAVNLFVFIFMTTSLVFVLTFDESAGITGYVDALYFTVATLTTTGFGDITMTTTGGKLLAVFIMVVGVALFVQLARAIFQPSKIKHKCPECGLNRHETDAIHCKHCGEPLKIETEGDTGT